MAKHEFIIVEKLLPHRVAFHETKYPEQNITNKIDIGPLFPPFSESMNRMYAKETGNLVVVEAAQLWMGKIRAF